MIWFVSNRLNVIDLSRSVKVQLVNALLFSAVAILIKEITYDFNGFIELLIGIVICLVLFTILFLLINVALFRRTFLEYKYNKKLGIDKT
ncbi:hypothetical protein SDC9_198849 [bioreactor metagenome]|uniref:Uncharacterized protein n=1 Tax=bioreactor metagenome TaxID=1076179 RepID=A0A645IIT8_9ZZZZ